MIIRGPDGTGEPRFTPTIVAFNGNASVGESVEAFMITFDDLRVPHRDSCRTNLCDYELLVLYALARLATYFPTICLISDGGKSSVQ